MTGHECDEFIDYFTSLFPDVERWLIDQNEAAAKKGQGEDFVQRAWYRSLSHVTLRGAKQAADIILGDEDQQPKGYTKLPARIAKIAKENGELVPKKKRSARPEPKRINGEWVFACPICKDQGMVDVFSGEAMDAVRHEEEFLWIKHAKPKTMRCLCAFGQSHDRSLVTYDPNKHELVTCATPTDADLARLAARFGVRFPNVTRPVHVRPQAEIEMREPTNNVGSLLSKGTALASTQTSAETPKREKLPEPKRFKPGDDEVPWVIDEANDLLQMERDQQ